MTMSWSARARQRGAGVKLFRPPEAQASDRRWHVVEDQLGGRMRLQWRPGIDVWHGEEGERWTAETASQLGWTYVGLSDNQVGGRA